jgi:magnesium-transporting ATPase (P-type)
VLFEGIELAPAADVEQVAGRRPLAEMRRGAITALAIFIILALAIGLGSFDSMGSSEAVSLVQGVGALTLLLFLSVPMGAIYAIFRGRRNRPTGRSLFPQFVLWSWMLLLVGAVAYFLTFAWYSESGGPPPQNAATQSALTAFAVLVCVVAVHVGLYRTTQPLQDRTS